MSNQTNKKSPQDRGDNEEKDINMSLRSIWLGWRDSPTFRGPRTFKQETSFIAERFSCEMLPAFLTPIAAGNWTSIP
jgi:hypothetical protein